MGKKKMSFSMYFDNNKSNQKKNEKYENSPYESIIFTDNDGNMLSNIDNSSNNSFTTPFKENNNKLINNILPRKTYIWVSDSNVLECYSCSLKFDMINRKHHCRLCGRIFCYECSKFYVNYYNLDNYQLINREKYMDFYLSNYKNFKSHRVCLNCKKILKQIKDLSHDIRLLELLNLDIKSYSLFKGTSKSYYNAVSILLSRIREIQYYLPGHIYNSFEFKYLLTNYNDILGHNRYFRNFLKILDKSNYKTDEIKKIIANLIKILILDKKKYCFKRTYNCWILMCNRDCNSSLDISDIVDILLNVENEDIREFVVKYFLTKLEISDEKLLCFLPILIYTIRFDKFKNQLSHYLIARSKKSELIRINFFWELKVQVEEVCYQDKYIQINNLFKKELLSEMGYSEYNTFIKQQEITNELFIFKNKSKLVDNIQKKTINEENIYKLPIYNEDSYVSKFHTNHIKIINSATQPLLIPYLDNKNNLNHILFKNEDIRKDRIITLIIKLFDIILKENELDMNITYYDVIPTSLNSGIIQIVDSSTTIYDIYNLHKTTLLNYILEKNSSNKVENLRLKFITSLASYCVITYLLGIGDRHLDNILIKDDGCLFHIDFNFILGADPKMFKSEIRITEEMINALGGTNSKNFDDFLLYVDKVYSILRRYPDLVLNCLFLLTKIKNQNIDINVLREQVNQRFMPGELETKANLSIKNTINSSSKAGGFTDFFHYQAKENAIIKGINGIIKKII
jgi:hypothetical protein